MTVETNVTKSDGHETVYRNRHGTRTMFEQFRSIEVAVTREPSSRKVRRHWQVRKSSQEPHPFALKMIAMPTEPARQ